MMTWASACLIRLLVLICKQVVLSRNEDQDENHEWCFASLMNSVLGPFTPLDPFWILWRSRWMDISLNTLFVQGFENWNYSCCASVFGANPAEDPTKSRWRHPLSAERALGRVQSLIEGNKGRERSNLFPWPCPADPASPIGHGGGWTRRTCTGNRSFHLPAKQQSMAFPWSGTRRLWAVWIPNCPSSHTATIRQNPKNIDSIVAWRKRQGGARNPYSLHFWIFDVMSNSGFVDWAFAFVS